ncbi:MFS transporter small subunit [Paeniglutamicibacter gangotriensis]|uniref:MFS transporter small subunit n=1 Tax=Paeniglutamicibacter gangotriensis TaxID=254787 RepID=UPI00165FC9DE|nr:hypothetical protein [Paeniglutamicibacter gangotriensis]
MQAHPHDAVAAEPSGDIPVNPATGRLIFGWLLVGLPLAYGVITTLSRVGQLFG